MGQGEQKLPQRWFGSLRARIITLLTVAVLPIGLIAVDQTNRLAKTADKNAELALLALSDQAVRGERLTIERAFGAAKMLGDLAPLLLDDPENCRPFLQRFLADERDFSFVGVLPKSGLLTCSSVETPLDFSEYSNFADLMANPRPNITLNAAAPASQTSVVVVSMPYDVNGDFAGYISVSVPQAKLAERKGFSELPVSGMVELFTINRTGEVIAAEHSFGTESVLLPKNLDQSLLEMNVAQSFRGEARSGDEYVYTLVPVDDSPMTIMGVWDTSSKVDQHFLKSAVPSFVFPVLMWVASIFVAVMALNTMMIRHIKVLRDQMVEFATNRQPPEVRLSGTASDEVIEIQSHFLELTDDILTEETRLNQLVHEQKVLAKEVHHRVKNNLQMIASIMNMQIRSAKSDETVETLQRVQDRITSLADVHNDLYASPKEGRINAGELIARSLQHSIEVGINDLSHVDISKEIEDMWLFPDQVVPLSLLASEAVTNAIKYMTPHGQGTPILSIELRQENDTCVFQVSNTTGSTEIPSGTGVGSKLIRAFGVKLGAETQTTAVDGVFTFKIAFPIADFEFESADF